MATRLLAVSVLAFLLGAAISSNYNVTTGASADSDRLFLADHHRQDRREGRRDNRDDRQDCRQDEGRVGDDKRECKQENRGEGDDVEADGKDEGAAA